MSITDAVKNFLSDNPEALDLPTKEIVDKILTLPGMKKSRRESVSRSIRKVRKKILETPIAKPEKPTGAQVSESDYQYRYKASSDTYDIHAGQWKFTEVPANVVQDWVQWYVDSGGRMTQNQVVRESSSTHNFTITKDQFRHILTALEVTKGSLPLAPHNIKENVDESVSIIREAQEAAIEAKLRARDAEHWRRKYEAVRKDRYYVERLGDRIAEHVRAGSPMSVPALSFDKKLQPYAAILFLSDWHVGQCFDFVLGKYNKDVFQDRLQQLVQECHDFFKAYSRPVDHLHIVVGGDMVDGVLPMRDQHNLQQDVWEGEQVDVASQALAWLIESTWKRVGAPCTVWSVGGNHDRAGGSRDSDPNRIVAQWLTQLTRARLPKEIEWNHSTEVVHTWKIYDTLVLLTHGDFSPKDPRKIVHPFRRPDVKNYLVLSAHLHAPELKEDSDVIWIRGGSMVGADPYGSARFGAAARPAQLMIEVRKDTGPRPATMIPLL